MRFLGGSPQTFFRDSLWLCMYGFICCVHTPTHSNDICMYTHMLLYSRSRMRFAHVQRSQQVFRAALVSKRPWVSAHVRELSIIFFFSYFFTQLFNHILLVQQHSNLKKTFTINYIIWSEWKVLFGFLCLCKNFALIEEACATSRGRVCTIAVLLLFLK